jgi:hypothetical protein
MIIVLLYVDGINFGGSNDKLCKGFYIQIKNEFEMAMLGELYVFLHL